MKSSTSELGLSKQNNVRGIVAKRRSLAKESCHFERSSVSMIPADLLTDKNDAFSFLSVLRLWDENNEN